MSRELDTQLLESVAVRRARLRESLVWGRERRVRATVDNIKRLAIGVVVAAVVSAGCVGWSFVQNLLAEQQARQQTGVTAPVIPRTNVPVAPPVGESPS
jgi:hypothetical protein